MPSLAFAPPTEARLLLDPATAGDGSASPSFGRTINLAEEPTALVALLRQVVERAVSPEEAVKAYHAALERARIRPDRSLADDLEVTDPILRAG